MVKTTSKKNSPAVSPAISKLKNEEDFYLTAKECDALKKQEWRTFCTYCNHKESFQKEGHKYFKEKKRQLWLFLMKHGVSTVEPPLIGSIHKRGRANVHSIEALYYFVIEQQRFLGLRESYETRLKLGLKQWLQRQSQFLQEYDPFSPFYLYKQEGTAYRYYSMDSTSSALLFNGMWLKEEHAVRRRGRKRSRRSHFNKPILYKMAEAGEINRR